MHELSAKIRAARKLGLATCGVVNLKQPYADYCGEQVSQIRLENNILTIHFVGGGGISMEDTAQFCCESRHMSTDDDISELIGGVIVGIEEKGEGSEGGYGFDVHEGGHGFVVHDAMFLEIRTHLGHAVFVNHNEHNGHYSGFEVFIKRLK